MGQDLLFDTTIKYDESSIWSGDKRVYTLYMFHGFVELSFQILVFLIMLAGNIYLCE